MGFCFPSGSDHGEQAWRLRASEQLPVLIHQLTPEQQRVVIGVFYEERSLEELACDLQCHPERLETLLLTALRTLRRQLLG